MSKKEKFRFLQNLDWQEFEKNSKKIIEIKSFIISFILKKCAFFFTKLVKLSKN